MCSVGPTRILESSPPPTAKKASVAAYFESIAPYWADVYQRHDVRSLRYQERFNAVLQLVNRCSLDAGSKILDLGCGAGVYSVALAKSGFFVEAVDSAPAMLELTRRRAADAQVGEKITAAEGDVYNLAFPDGAFSMVLAIGVIPWLESPQEAIAQLARVLRPDGYLVMTADNRWRLDALLDPLISPVLVRARRFVRSVFGISYWQRHAPPADAVFACEHSVRDVDELFAGAGLTRVHVETLGFGPFTFFTREFLPDRLGVKLHRMLQLLANLGCPGLRSTGWQIVILARKR